MHKQGLKVSVRVLSALMVMMLAVMIVLPAQAAPAATGYEAVFDSEYYASHYPDLQAAFGNNAAQLLNHFIAHGMAEGRQGNAEFNVQYYKARYADLQAAFGDNLPLYYMHYITNGKAEGRVANGAAPASAPASGTSSTPASGSNVVTTGAAVGATAVEVQYSNEVIALINQIRASYGLSTLTTSQALQDAAQVRATEISTVFSHTRPNGSTPDTVLTQYGISYGYRGENIAAGQPTPAVVVDSWMNSAGHRANILKPEYNHIGVGCYMTTGGYGIYWSQVFTD